MSGRSVSDFLLMEQWFSRIGCLWRMKLRIVATNRKSVCDLDSKRFLEIAIGRVVSIEAKSRVNAFQVRDHSCSFFESLFYL